MDTPDSQGRDMDILLGFALGGSFIGGLGFVYGVYLGRKQILTFLTNGVL